MSSGRGKAQKYNVPPPAQAGEAEIKALQAKISRFKGQITRAHNFAHEQASQVLIDDEGIQVRIMVLRDYYKEYLDNYNSLKLLLGETSEDDFNEDDNEERCLEAIARLQRILRNKDKTISTDKDQEDKSRANEEQQQRSSKLPQLDIASFSGIDITQYTPFMEIFQAVIGRERTLTGAQKLCYLKKYLKGDALLLVDSLPLMSESYEQALGLLDKRYNNKCLLTTHHVNALLDLQPVSRGTSQELRHLVSVLRQHLGALRNLGQQTQHWDALIIPTILRKLDAYTCRAYYADRDQTSLPTVEELFAFLEKRAMSFEESSVSGKSQFSCYKPNKSAVNLANVNTDDAMHSNSLGSYLVNVNAEPRQCKFCKSKEHRLFQCQEYLGLTAQDRVNFVTEQKLCKVCLNIHSGKCKFHFKCSVCKSKAHNSLLHLDEKVTLQVQQVVNNFAQPCADTITNELVLLPTIKVNFRGIDGSYVTAKGLLDSGSQVSFISTSLVEKLQMPTFERHLNVTGLGGSAKQAVTEAINLSMHSQHNNYCCNTLFSVVDNITSYLPQTKLKLSELNIPETIQLADKEYNIPEEIYFLVNAKVFFNILMPDKISLKDTNLYLVATRFGYVVSGELQADNVCLLSQSENNNSVSLHANVEPVDSLLQRFWEDQHTPEPKIEPTQKTDECETIFQNTVKFFENRFQVELPVKLPVDEVNFGDSYSIAFQRLQALCRRFAKNSQLKHSYSNFINEYVALGHAEEVNLKELQHQRQQCYFLPHHPVLKPDSITTKVRAVFDASAKCSSAQSLNDIVHTGPVESVQKNLFDVLILFRTYKYIAMTDIKQMFRQVLVEPSQRHLQMILWKENLQDPVKCFQLKTVTYGVACSTYLAARCLIELAQRYEQTYPRGASVLRDNRYVDDCLFGASSIQELKDIRDELIALMGLGSFELHKWCANNADTLVDIPSNKQHFQEVQLGNDNLTLKALGLSLNVSKDQFIISRPKGELPTVWTKRTVLSFIGTFFDPLGLAGPIVTKAKEFLQKIWLQHLGWDVPLPSELLLPWNKFFTDLMVMQPIGVDRYLSNHDSFDLIGYCDASNIAFGACIYVRSVVGEAVYVKLLCSKSRITPIKEKLTMPRLELNACLLLAKLFVNTYNILSSHKVNKKILCSDSQIALCWIQNPPKDQYVKNRADKIKVLTSDCVWTHVPGHVNPADCLSRGLFPSELSKHTLWWSGPPEIQENNVNFVPFQVAGMQTELQVNCTVNVTEELLPLTKISSFIVLQRIVCYVLRFIKNCKLDKGQRNNSKAFSAVEYRASLIAILKQTQASHFSEEINLIKGQRSNNITSNLKKLCPFIDTDGLLRVGGRLDNANIPFSQKHPIILPKLCNTTTSIIRNEHLALMHSGLKLTLSSLARKYYIVNATTRVKSIINKCMTCFKFRAQHAQQLMAALPKDRVTQDRPFNKVGIDYCGPFDIKQSTLRRSIVSKGYVCVLVCFVTKCIHLELVSDLSTESFLAAFKRFIARRGMPHTVYCDNGSNFRGANNQLRKLFELCKSKDHDTAVTTFCSQNGIHFRFIPSYSPTWGGLWEAAVKSAKYHFKRIIGKTLFNYEQFNTIIVQVEAVLNSRPITELSKDVSDFSVLTPGHFLVNQSLTAIPETDLLNDNINVLRFWRKCTKIRQDFWNVWHKSYLSQLLSRPKWFRVTENLKEGMLVLLIGDKVSPLEWPVARISKTFQGPDGKVRMVEVKSKGYCSKRAINKVALLPIYDDN